MDDLHENREAGPDGGGGSACELPARLLELMGCLVADVASDVEVVARELGLRDEMRERLRRALDRVGYAKTILEAIAGGMPDHRSATSRPGATTLSREGNEYKAHHAQDAGLIAARVAIDELAKNWPQDYSADAIEWLLLPHLTDGRRAAKQACGFALQIRDN